jgi:tetratricopeptide (TPR) repeat protein
MNPNLEYLYSRLGQICRLKGDEEGALREFRQAIRVVERKSQREPACATFWRELADIYHKVGDYEQASIARSRLQDAELNELYEGDHRKRIAGPDTGFLTTTN